MKGCPGAGIHVDVADEKRDIADFRVQLLQCLEILGNEARFENKVLGRITGDREFRCENQFRATLHEFVVGGEDLAGVAGDIANDGFS